MGRTGASFDQKSIGFDFLLDKFPEIEPFPEIELFTRNRFGNHGSHIDFFFGKRDQDFRTFPENLKGDFKIYFSNHLFLAGTVPTNLYIYIYIYIYI